MTCPEVDFLRELDLFDFPEEKEFYGQAQFPPPPFPYSQNAHNYTQQMHSFGILPRARQDDFFAGFPSELEDKQLLDSFEPLLPRLESRDSLDTLSLFDFEPTCFGKRNREEVLFKEVPLQNKKRKLTETRLSPTTPKVKSKQKRTKWLRKEVQSLWQGIATYGNNWRLIKKKAFGHRTYYQVKDKGRRILSSQGWSSGRTKATHDGASEEAKMIAERILTLAGKGEFNLEDGTSTKKNFKNEKKSRSSTPISSASSYERSCLV